MDGSAGMLELARKQEGLYKDIREVLFGEGALPEDMKGRFRLATCVGLLLKGHAPPETLDEMVASLVGEKGDLLIFIIREDGYLQCGHKEKLDQLVADGVIEQIHEKWHKRTTNNEIFSDELYKKATDSILMHYVLTGKK